MCLTIVCNHGLEQSNPASVHLHHRPAINRMNRYNQTRSNIEMLSQIDNGSPSAWLAIEHLSKPTSTICRRTICPPLVWKVGLDVSHTMFCFVLFVGWLHVLQVFKAPLYAGLCCPDRLAPSTEMLSQIDNGSPSAWLAIEHLSKPTSTICRRTICLPLVLNVGLDLLHTMFYFLYCSLVDFMFCRF